MDFLRLQKNQLEKLKKEFQGRLWWLQWI